MEGRLKFIVGILILAVLISTGKDILEKKALKKSSLSPKSQTPESKDSPKKVSAPEASAPTASELSVAAPPEKEPEVLKEVSVTDLEAEGGKALCESEWEKSFCPRLKNTLISAKGTRIIDNRLIVFVDNDAYFARAERYVNPPVEIDPARPVEVKSQVSTTVDEKEVNEKRVLIAGALFLRELIQSFKPDLKDRNLTIVFLKNPVSPMAKNTFALECRDGPLQELPVESLSDEKLKALEVDYSLACRPLTVETLNSAR